MSAARSYPDGVPSWVDIEHRDVPDAVAFYGGLFGWTFTEAASPSASIRYHIAQLDGHDVAGVRGPVDDGPVEVTGGWNTYVAVEDADVTAARVEAAGGRVLERRPDADEGGRSTLCADPAGVPFRLWQAGRRLGAQAVNMPGAWNFSDLHASDPAASERFYAEVFGWSVDDLGFASMVRKPGYGDHLAATIDPEIHERQAAVGAPPGFADAIAWLAPVGPDEQPHWHVSFTVADRDATATQAERLGCRVLDSTDTDWTRVALIRDPQGGVFTASQFSPRG